MIYIERSRPAKTMGMSQAGRWKSIPNVVFDKIHNSETGRQK
jgi:hypothetical protein